MAATPSVQQQVTQFLVDWSSGDTSALDKLIPLVQPELHRLAHYYMSREGEGHTLQTTARLNAEPFLANSAAFSFNPT